MIRKLVEVAAAALAILLPCSARADWREYETAHFIIYSESGEKDIDQLAERLESVDGLMRMATGLGGDVEPVKVRIYHVASNDDVSKAVGLSGSGSGIAGFYESNALGPFLVTPRKTYFGDADFTPELVLHHEYAHHFMLQYFPAIYPSWYTEGFAELIGSSRFMPDGRIAYGMPAKHRGHEIAVDWVSLKDLLTKPPEKIGAFDLYGQGWAMTHFFTFSKTRSAQLRQFLGAMLAGRSQAEAAKVFGDLDALNREARDYVTKGTFEYRPVKVEIKRPVIQAVHPVSAGEAALIPETIAFRDEELSIFRKPGERQHEMQLREDNLQRIRKKTRLYPTEPAALYLLAEAEAAAGNADAAEAAADRLLAIQPNHARALARKAIAVAGKAASLEGSARAAKLAEARQLAVRANRADPNDPIPLVAFYQTYHLVGLPAPKQVVENLYAAVLTLPSDTRIRQLLVDELASEKRWGGAIAVLMPIANSPHDSPRRAAAQEQLAKLKAQQAKAAS